MPPIIPKVQADLGEKAINKNSETIIVEQPFAAKKKRKRREKQSKTDTSEAKTPKVIIGLSQTGASNKIKDTTEGLGFSAPHDPSTSRYDASLADGRTIWINHPSLPHPHPRALVEVIEAKARLTLGEEEDLTINTVYPQGPRRTALRTRTSDICDKILGSVSSATFTDAHSKKHSLHIQPYRGGGTKTFFLSRCGTAAEKVDTLKKCLEKSYPDNPFRLRQCMDREITSSFFLTFDKAPQRLIRNVSLAGGIVGLMVPILPGKRCPNLFCQRGQMHTTTDCEMLSDVL